MITVGRLKPFSKPHIKTSNNCSACGSGRRIGCILCYCSGLCMSSALQFTKYLPISVALRTDWDKKVKVIKL